MSGVILYSYFRSSTAWRVRLALGIKGIEYEYRPISLFKGEQKSPKFLKISPLGQVPVLIIDGQTFVQSVSILEYLEETRTKKPLLPSDPKDRAKVREIVEMINSGIHPLTNMSPLQKISMERNAQLEWLHHWGKIGFQALEQVLSKSAGKFCFQDQVTLADLFLVPQATNAIRWGIDLKEYPITFNVFKRLESLEKFKKAHPSVQPDCPEKLKNVQY